MHARTRTRTRTRARTHTHTRAHAHTHTHTRTHTHTHTRTHAHAHAHADSTNFSEAAKMRMSANGAPQGWTALGRGHNPPVSIVRNMLVDDSDSDMED